MKAQDNFLQDVSETLRDIQSLNVRGSKAFLHLDDILRWLAETPGDSRNILNDQCLIDGYEPDEIRARAYEFLEQALFAHPANSYQVLGLDSSADKKTIKQRYHRLLKVYHPDVYRQDDSDGANYTILLNQAHKYVKAGEGGEDHYEKPAEKVLFSSQSASAATGKYHASTQHSGSVLRRRIGLSADQFRNKVFIGLSLASVVLIVTLYFDNRPISPPAEKSIALNIHPRSENPVDPLGANDSTSKENTEDSKEDSLASNTSAKPEIAPQKSEPLETDRSSTDVPLAQLAEVKQERAGAEETPQTHEPEPVQSKNQLKTAEPVAVATRKAGIPPENSTPKTLVAVLAESRHIPKEAIQPTQYSPQQLSGNGIHDSSAATAQATENQTDEPTRTRKSAPASDNKPMQSADSGTPASALKPAVQKQQNNKKVAGKKAIVKKTALRSPKAEPAKEIRKDPAKLQQQELPSRQAAASVESVSINKPGAANLPAGQSAVSVESLGKKREIQGIPVTRRDQKLAVWLMNAYSNAVEEGDMAFLRSAFAGQLEINGEATQRILFLNKFLEMFETTFSRRLDIKMQSIGYVDNSRRVIRIFGSESLVIHDQQGAPHVTTHLVEYDIRKIGHGGEVVRAEFR